MKTPCGLRCVASCRSYPHAMLVSLLSISGAQSLVSAQDTLYRCRKCRRLVATGDNVVTVPAGGSRQRPFSWGFRPQELSSAPCSLPSGAA